METGGLFHRKLCKRWDVESDVHLLTFSCFGRQPFLRSARACGWFLDALQAAREKLGFDLWAYVLMPEHVHLVVWPRTVKISRILQSIKLPVARKALFWVRDNSPEFLKRMADCQPNGQVAYRFWLRGGGYDRNLRSVADVYEKIRYVHENPVRRELVARPEDWTWSSCRAHFLGVDEPIPIDRDSMPLPPVE